MESQSGFTPADRMNSAWTTLSHVLASLEKVNGFEDSKRLGDIYSEIQLAMRILK